MSNMVWIIHISPPKKKISINKCSINKYLINTVLLSVSRKWPEKGRSWTYQVPCSEWCSGPDSDGSGPVDSPLIWIHIVAREGAEACQETEVGCGRSLSHSVSVLINCSYFVVMFWGHESYI